MAKIQKIFVGTQGNKSFYRSELFRKILQTSRGKDFTVGISFAGETAGNGYAVWRKHCISVFSFHFCPFSWTLSNIPIDYTLHFFLINSKTLLSAKQCSGKSKAVKNFAKNTFDFRYDAKLTWYQSLHLRVKREKIKERQCEATFLHIFGNWTTQGRNNTWPSDLRPEWERLDLARVIH